MVCGRPRFPCRPPDMLPSALILTLGLLMTGDAEASGSPDAGVLDGAGPDGGALDSGVAAAPPPSAPTSPMAARPPVTSLAGAVWQKGTRRRLAGASVTLDAAPAGESDDS